MNSQLFVEGESIADSHGGMSTVLVGAIFYRECNVDLLCDIWFALICFTAAWYFVVRDRISLLPSYLASMDYLDRLLATEHCHYQVNYHA